MISLKDTTHNRELDFVHVTEAGLEDKSAPVMKGYTAFKADHKKYSSGSAMYVRNGYVSTLLRITGKRRRENSIEKPFYCTYFHPF